MRHPFFFGYGSLVNRRTHDFPEATPARVKGWRRMWRHTMTRPVAYLTVRPCAETEIDGLIAGVPGADWADLDERERAYDRVAEPRVAHRLDHSPDVHIYWVPEGKHQPASVTHPILLSYLDVVVQGYHAEYGRDGVAEFFATTDGWNSPILYDRKSPRYSRHQTLARDERLLVDTMLEDYRITILSDGGETG